MVSFRGGAEMWPTGRILHRPQLHDVGMGHERRSPPRALRDGALMTIDVYCTACGSKLDAQLTGDACGVAYIEVEPCAKCLYQAKLTQRVEDEEP